MIIGRGSKHLQWAKDNLFNKWCWENCTDACRKTKLDYFLTPHTGINSKWIKDFSVRPKTIKILDENIGSKILYIALSNILSDISPQARETKEKNKQLGLHQTKKVLPRKRHVKKIKGQISEWENIFTYTFDKGLASNIVKNLTKLNTKKKSN